ncbi:hypothetical protein ACWIB8_05335 [Corynebacterium flavescens]
MSPKMRMPSTSQATKKLPPVIEWAGIISSIIVAFGTIGTVLGIFMLFSGDSAVLATLGAGVSLLVSGMVLKVLVEIWKKIPGEGQLA